MDDIILGTLAWTLWSTCDVNVAVGQFGLGVVQAVQGLKITGTDNISRLASRWTGVMPRREQNVVQ